MIHAYACIKDNNNNHSDHGANFLKLMNTINSNSVVDPHRPFGGYSITMLHEIKYKNQYKCKSCGDLVNSTKIRGPSCDDCIERIGANSSCQNLMCHWHRHKKQCSGSYCIVRESSSSCAELKGPKAIASIEGSLDVDEGKSKESALGSWHGSHTSKKGGTSKKHGLEDSSVESLHPIDDAIGSSGLDGSLRDRSNKKLKLLKDIDTDLVASLVFQEVPKHPRIAVLNNNQERNRQKKRKISEWDGSYTVIIGWLNYHAMEESSEDEVPLINKRTERRKRQKMLNVFQASKSYNGFGGASSTSHVVNGGHGTIASQLNSPTRDEMVYISDG